MLPTSALPALTGPALGWSSALRMYGDGNGTAGNATADPASSYSAVVPVFLSLGILSTVGTFLIMAIFFSSPKIRKEHVSILIFFITVRGGAWAPGFRSSAAEYGSLRTRTRQPPLHATHILAPRCRAATYCTR